VTSTNCRVPPSLPQCTLLKDLVTSNIFISEVSGKSLSRHRLPKYRHKFDTLSRPATYKSRKKGVEELHTNHAEPFLDLLPPRKPEDMRFAGFPLGKNTPKPIEITFASERIKLLLGNQVPSNGPQRNNVRVSRSKSLCAERVEGNSQQSCGPEVLDSAHRLGRLK
jgi:hypothetical protein